MGAGKRAPKKVRKLADQIHGELCESPARLEWFRAQVHEALRRVVQLIDEEPAWLKLREEHARQIAESPDLRNPDQHQPPGRKWDTFRPDYGEIVAGWTPPGLSYECRRQFELDLVPGGVDPGLPVKCLALALLHDATIDATDRRVYVPADHNADEDGWPSPTDREWWNYVAMLGAKQSLLWESESQLSRYLREVMYAPGYSHSDDFRSVGHPQLNGGVPYEFNANQAAVMRLLLDHWNRGRLAVGGEALLNAIDHACPPDRLDLVFRSHPAWGTMIIPGTVKGTYRLADPTK